MDFKKLANQAKAELDKASVKAKTEFEQRGGADGLKAGAKNVADATKSKGSVTDKAKAAAAAAKDAAAKKPGPVA